MDIGEKATLAVEEELPLAGASSLAKRSVRAVCPSRAAADMAAGWRSGTRSSVASRPIVHSSVVARTNGRRRGRKENFRDVINGGAYVIMGARA
jgi:hypothetical protein